MIGYIIRYSDGTTGNKTASSSSTSTSISGLTVGRTYTISVEALSQHLSGVSETRTITIGEDNDLYIRACTRV